MFRLELEFCIDEDSTLNLSHATRVSLLVTQVDDTDIYRTKEKDSQISRSLQAIDLDPNKKSDVCSQLVFVCLCAVNYLH